MKTKSQHVWLIVRSSNFEKSFQAAPVVIEDEEVLSRRRVNRSDVAGFSGSYVKLVRDIMFVSLRSLWNPNSSNCVMWSVISLADEGVEKLAA